MTRFACVFLPEWPVERFRKAQHAQPPQTADSAFPFALVKSASGGLRLTAVDFRARALGLVPGELLADARARVPAIRASPAEPAKDRAALVKLAYWSMRFSPFAGPWRESTEEPCHGLTLDIGGCDHLFGGEEALAQLMVARFRSLGFTARVAIVGTIGAAHALACHGEKPITVVVENGQRDAVVSLPVAALRVRSGIAGALRKFGLERIGDLLGLPRASLTQRFGSELVESLDRIIGNAPESFSPLAPNTPYRAATTLAEPVTSQDDVLTLIHRMANDLKPLLERNGVGVRALRLFLFRVDGEVKTLDVRLSVPSREPSHIAKLFSLRLETLSDEIDAGFGFDAARLDVTATQKTTPSQVDLAPDPVRERDSRLGYLIDRLGSRLGVENVLRAHSNNTHIPERAVVFRPATHRVQPWDDDIEALARPLLMLPAAEPAEAIASVPEGPPRSFRWRNVHYKVTHAEGPERIRAEWWHNAGDTCERDYYVVEDEEGRRFWLYREGAYSPDHSPRWYVHGVFA